MSARQMTAAELIEAGRAADLEVWRFLGACESLEIVARHGVRADAEIVASLRANVAATRFKIEVLRGRAEATS